VPESAAAAELPNLAFTEKFTRLAALQNGVDLPASRAMPSPIPGMDTKVAAAGDRPAEFAKNRVDGAPQLPAADIRESVQMPEERHGTGERQHPSDEAPAPPRDYKEPTAREAARIEKPGFEPLAPISISGKGVASSESPQPNPTAKPANVPNLEVEPTPLQSPPSSHTPDAHAISVRVTDAGEARVELKVTEHAGELRVAVRTADQDLAGSLRENLGDLVHKLEQSGLRADTWHPAQASSSEGNRQTARAEGDSLGEDHSGRQQQHSGDGRERKHQDPQRAAWMDEFETSITPDSERKAPTWLQL
jgi:hypothetical protein